MEGKTAKLMLIRTETNFAQDHQGLGMMCVCRNDAPQVSVLLDVSQSSTSEY